jgi:hypothetical protein
MLRKRTPTEERPEPETVTAVAEPPIPETTTTIAEPPISDTNGKSFADRVGQRQWRPAPDPFGIATDYIAGVRLFESKQDRQMAIMFGDGSPQDRPSQAVIDTMKSAGYRWNSADRIWAHLVRPESARTTRIEAERLYQDVCKMIRLEKGIEAGPDISR